MRSFVGPLLAPKSYVPPSRPNKFPLVIFNEVWNGDPFLDELGDEIKELFNVRNYYLDTSDENKCNWMIHVDIAKFSNEQNLMAYQVRWEGENVMGNSIEYLDRS